ncbi:Adenosylmethionine-8-amino-7-oxononanoate aminotransferase [Agreia bicolorata]|uniref:Adenosylmethionine-8-amino-7-oxononanoate aminotransferase n=1 Tax=Agreia bicolorata TaxID=110935 RepID=A0A1T4WPY4_9MICO|nr:aminotransferase class III-fold pyridoxal phosphate-dependent enzyme [Agreia bicolorata]SKA79432.1 Adenosylmethionine-8-amino-7-oxononanoate aminotransferase [Agreia bicolorata]
MNDSFAGIPGSTGSALWSAQAHMPSVLGNQIEIARGEGAYVWTTEGQRLLDATAGLWHANIGHGRPELAQAAYEQMLRLETYHVFGRFLNDRAVELADRIAAYAPFNDAKVIFGSGGSDAVDSACKLARRHWQLQGKPEKTMVLSRTFAYHGLHAYGTSIAGLQFNRDGFGTDSLVPETERVDHSDLASVIASVDRIGAHRIAAIVAEPIMGTGGVIPPAPGYLEGVQKLCAENDILFIADEVITGFGRAGTMFASERFGIVPDMLLMAKGITSGYAPLGGILVAPRIWQQFYAGLDAPILRHGLTYAGHATAAAVAMANLDVLENDGLVARAAELEAVLDGALDRLRGRERVVDVRIAGFLGGVQLDERIDGDRLSQFALDRGVILRILRGNTVQISPPFVVTDDEVASVVAVIDEAIADQDGIGA